MRFKKIGKTILLALSLTAIIVTMSCSGADATKPENLKADLNKELGSGKTTALNLTLQNNNGKYVLVAGGTSSFFSGLYISGYTDGAGITVTGISKVIDTSTMKDITGSATPVYNAAGGVYKINISDSAVNNVNIEYNYKLKVPPTQVIKTTPTKIGINNHTTNWNYIDLYTEIGGSSEGSLFGKTYVIGTAKDINIATTTYTSGLITNNILTNLNMANGEIYKLWVY